ncbi:MAG: phytanoyl-CoA dioxygenase family protein [FCB group bacterium]|nr:phytanoyl-CoA dioxygenase family protein [FCB group bacterium]MBL7029359.1 phytanoyl-CoA dioxygenase family protein [Candidatus Neomarinimicrobiota bacterium]MBL7123042.1 phytanoyl-CoA dioxygenase family protein [Candidatus Neomarinimicrobiota bacterium]
MIDIGSKMQEQYGGDGYIRITNGVAAESLEQLAVELRDLMAKLNPNSDPIDFRSTYKRAFTQVTNLWQKSDIVRDFVFRKDLAEIAAKIMGVSSVRLYHDQALFKEAGGGATPWHVDQVYWPLDTSNTCTFWIPLQKTPSEMGTLSFARGSHLKTGGREMVISDESETFFSQYVRDSGFEVSADEFELGDISIHSGWTVHHAGPNLTDQTREVMTIIYMADDARLLKSPSKTQYVNRDAFTPDVQLGESINTLLNPTLYSTH